MAGDTTITIIGNTTSDPELRFTPSGAAVANLTIASTPRSYDKNTQAWVDGETLFMRCSIWREAAENVAESITRGMRVVATGRLKQRSFEKDGQKRTVVEMELDEIGPSLRYATARVTKAERNQGGQQQPAQGGGWGGKPREAQSGPPSHEGWGQAPPAGQTQGRIPNQPLPAQQQGGGWGRDAGESPF